MKIEHAEEFGDLFHGTASQLHKMISFQIYAMETCERQR